MILIFSIKDSKTGGFDKPFSAAHVEQVIRSLKSSFSSPRPGDNYNEFPEDYSLWMVGEFNQSTGEITPCDSHVINFIDIKNSLMKGSVNA